MSSFVDVKYVNQLGMYLELFKQKSENVWNFRCPYCGDSQTNKTKTRGYVYLKESKYNFRCHNCNHGTTLAQLIKHVNVSMYNQYILETYGDRSKTRKTSNYKTKVTFNNSKTIAELKGLKKISQLPPGHKVKQYIVDRGLPPNTHHLMYYAPKYNKLVNTFEAVKLDEKYDEARIVLPFVDRYGKLIGITGRSMKTNPSLKYINVSLDKSTSMIYGLDRADKSKKIYVVEGPFDSLFLDNCIAMGGADITKDIINEFDCVIIYDNEPRNQQIVDKMENWIDAGVPVVIWPSNIPTGNDINDLVKSGMSKEDIMNVIDDHTYKALKAKSKLSEWRKS